MYSFTITKNANADIQLFDWWMRLNYQDYDGCAFREDESFITVYSATEFSTEEKSAISTYYAGLTTNDVIADKYCRIYDYVTEHESGLDKTVVPQHINYVSELKERLHPLITDIVKGEVREITYYASVTLNQDGTLTGNTPVVREEFVYTRDVAKMAISRVMKIYWILQDGTDHPQFKERVKYYSPEQRIVEGQTLRKNIIDYTQPVALGMIMQTEQVDYDTAVTMGAELFHAYASNIDSWIYASRGSTLQTTIENDTSIAWLDNVVNIPQSGNTIRDYVLDQLNY